MLLKILLVVIGATCLYLSSANQRLLARAIPRVPGVVTGMALFVAGTVLLAQDMQALTAISLGLHLAMLCLVAYPFFAALRALRR